MVAKGGSFDHGVEVVATTDLATADGLRKHSDIFLANKQVHSALHAKICEDFAGKEDEEINKTYLVEIFGAPGGDHVCSLTIRKEAGQTAPLVHLIDSSPELVRNGLAIAQSRIAKGFCAQLVCNATLKKAFADIGFEFDNDRFFNNSQPLQERGFATCGLFANEAAHQMARLDKYDHLALLESYKYPSPYGGKTELDVRPDKLDASGGYLSKEDLAASRSSTGALPPGLLRLSNFVDDATVPQAEFLSTALHVRKTGEEESEFERVARHQTPVKSEEEKKIGGHNQTIDEKAFKQRIGHLFEIITNPRFLAISKEEVRGKVKPVILPEPGRNPYMPRYKDGYKMPDAVKPLVMSYNKGILMGVGSFNHCQEKEGQYSLVSYMGLKSAEKLLKMMAEEASHLCESNLEIIDFADNVIGASEEFTKIAKFDIMVAPEKLDELKGFFNSKSKFLLNAQESPPSRAFALRSQDSVQTLISELEISGCGTRGV